MIRGNHRFLVFIALFAFFVSCLGPCINENQEQERQFYSRTVDDVSVTIIGHLGLRGTEKMQATHAPRDPMVIFGCALDCAACAIGPIPSLDLHVKLNGKGVPADCIGSHDCDGGSHGVFERWGPQSINNMDELKNDLHQMKLVHCHQGERHAFFVDPGDDESSGFLPFGVYTWKGLSWITDLVFDDARPASCEELLKTMDPVSQILKRYKDECEFYSMFDKKARPSRCQHDDV